MSNPMKSGTVTWQNRSPGNLDILLPEVEATPVTPAVEKAVAAAKHWATTPLTDRIVALQAVQSDIASISEKLALGIATEIGKPLGESRGEVAVVQAKITFTIQDAERYLRDEAVLGGPHPAAIRQRPRGPAAVIGPFNFPLHLGNGGIMAHLIAGNPVLFKPSPFAPHVASEYGAAIARHLPDGVFQVVQGLGATSSELCAHPAIRSICFTGSVAIGRQIAVSLAADFSKDVALELGGKNSLVIAADADIAAAAKAAADGTCLTAGQRCNCTSRVLVERMVWDAFNDAFAHEILRYVPGDPTMETTTLGPVVSAAARERHEKIVDETGAETFGSIPETLRGHYVLPAVIRRKRGDPLLTDEQFVPIVEIIPVSSLEEAIALQRATDFGLSASIFTKSESTWRWFVDHVEAGNVYANLPTTLSPSTLPFGGWKNSGNHHPAGKGFLRYVTNEQATQWTGF